MWTCNLFLEVVVSVEGISAIFARLFVLMPENHQRMARYVISRTCVHAKDIASISKGIALEYNKRGGCREFVFKDGTAIGFGSKRAFYCTFKRATTLVNVCKILFTVEL